MRLQLRKFWMDWRRINIFLAIVAVLTAAVTAQAMIPRRLLGTPPTQEGLESMIPKHFGQWTYEPSVRMVRTQGTDELSKLIYSAELARGFRDEAGNVIMLMIAYGPSQSDHLQVHRPEICYSAQGFRVSRLEPANVDLGAGEHSLPVRRLIAQREERLEPITYWIRSAETVATSAVDRQIVKIEYGLRGYVTDSVLIRVSVIGLPPEKAYPLQERFIRDLIHALNDESRKFVIGDLNRVVGVGF
jgi:EpsI family protein